MNDGTEQVRGRQILVVEDEYYLAIDLEQMLSDLGVGVVGPVPSVKAALALMDATPRLDGAILDVNLGGEQVFPVADRLSARGVPFLFATGYGRQDIPERFAQIACIYKPVEPSSIARALQQALAASATRS